MNLIEIYETAIVSKDYSVFKSAIDKQMNGIPETVISTNEFKLVNVDLAGVSKSACEHNWISSVAYKGARICSKCNDIR